SRIQIMQEYTGLVFLGTHTPNTTFDRRDPVDGVWGVRIYPWNFVALDVGYRYMLNLQNAEDRHGFVVKLATTYWPVPPKPVNRDPIASCSASPGSVYAGSGDPITVRASASDPDGNPLTYDWTATGGSVTGTGAEARWSSAGTSPGTYTVTARVSDGAGGTANCAVDVRVEPKPNAPPTMSCSADRASVLVGERVRITARASDPDNDTLSYSWRSNGGQVLGSGNSVQLDTSGLAPGRYTVTGRVDDGRGAAGDCTTSIDVQAPPPPPQASKLNECFFKGVGSARVDNVCKRILDDVALRMQSDARATIVIVGFADPKEPRSARLAQQRGDNAAKYLASRGVDAARSNVRAAGGQAGAGKQNRRIDVIWVPQGATY
ncbi:MAG: PKD domain-containing protein, partial [Acidobacteria bacterium]|nr:PKD domain-containing protein [Acidobacteriota bacterium]